MVQIKFDFKELKDFGSQFANGMTEAAFPNTANAMHSAVGLIHSMWTDYLTGDTSLPGIPNLSDVTSSMVRSVRTRKNADFDYSVYSDDMQLAKLTKGSAPQYWDMKQTHPYGRKSRMSKDNIPYLIIPFRWGTPNGHGTKRAHFNNVIPQKYYETNLKPLALSRTNRDKNYYEQNFRGENIERAGYDWAKNGRLTKENAWSKNSVGMVRMADVTGSTYFTFRIISANSPAGSWIYKKHGKPGIDMMNALKNATEKPVNDIMQQGIQHDIDMYKNQ